MSSTRADQLEKVMPSKPHGTSDSKGLAEHGLPNISIVYAVFVLHRIGGKGDIKAALATFVTSTAAWEWHRVLINIQIFVTGPSGDAASQKLCFRGLRQGGLGQGKCTD